MKKYILIVETPDCFTPNTDTVEIHFKGSPAESYTTAKIMPFPIVFSDSVSEANDYSNM